MAEGVPGREAWGAARAEAPWALRTRGLPLVAILFAMGGALARASGAGAALALALALGAPPAQAGPPLPGTPPARTGAAMNLRPEDAAAMGLVRRPSPVPSIDKSERLQRIELDARAGIRALQRDLARDAQAPALRKSGSPEAIAEARAAWHTEERFDAIQSQIDWDKVLTPGPWDHPGPVTRRILEQSRIRLRTQERQRAVDARADALRPPPAAPPQLGDLPPTTLEPPSR